MESIKSQLSSKTWRRDPYYISTDPKLIPLSALSAIFASDDFYWAKTLPEAAMREMLENSLTFGLFKIVSSPVQPNPAMRNQRSEVIAAIAADQRENLRFLGVARCVTDFITFVYLTDVWVDPSYQGKGLGTWLIECVQTVVADMPHLRRSMLFTADWNRSVPFYRKLMDMSVIETRQNEGLAIMESKGRGHPSYGKEGNGY